MTQLIHIDDCDTPYVTVDAEGDVVVQISCERGPMGPQGPPGTGGTVDSVVAGTGIAVDATDPANPIVSCTVTGSVTSVNTQTGAVVLDTDDILDTTQTNKYTTAADIAKLAGIAAGAEVNVNADWNAVAGDALILNKPAIPSTADLFNKITDDSDDIVEGATNLFFSVAEQTKLSGIAAGAEVNVNADWNAVAGDALILNKPTIPDISDLFNKVTDDTDDITEGATNLFFTSAEQTKLAGIEALADVTDATNVAAAGAVMEADTVTTPMQFVIDEDNMASNLDTKVPTQQSVKAYVDAFAGTIITDHGGLTGLLDDDHTQYGLLAGRSGGQDFSGGLLGTEYLRLRANAATFDSRDTGRIELKSQVVWDDATTITGVFDGFLFTIGDFGLIKNTGTFTISSSMNAGNVSTVAAASTIKYSTGQVITSAPTFLDSNIIQPTASLTDNSACTWMSFSAQALFAPLLSTAVTATTVNFVSYFGMPRVGITSGSHASAAAVVTDLTVFEAFASLTTTVTSQATVTNARGLRVRPPTKTGTGAITNTYGVDVEALSTGATSNIGVRIAKANTYTLQLSSTDGTAAGGMWFGTDTNLYRSAADTLKTDDNLIVGTVSSSAGSVATVNGTQTISNKRNTKRVTTITSAAQPVMNTDTTDMFVISALATNITSFTNNISGTPVAGDVIWIAITDNGTARTITWDAAFESSGRTILPTTTVISQRLDIGFVYNTSSSSWRCIAVS